MNKVEHTPYSEWDLYYIKELKQKGYGWEKYAVNVENQGWISEAQRVKLSNMWLKVNCPLSSKSYTENDTEYQDYGGGGGDYYGE